MASIVEQLASILDTMRIIWHHEGNNVFTSWEPIDGGDLTELVDGQAYTIYMNSPDRLEYTDPQGRSYLYNLKVERNDIVWKAIEEVPMLGNIAVRIAGYPKDATAWALAWYDPQINNYVRSPADPGLVSINQPIELTGISLEHFALIVYVWDSLPGQKYPPDAVAWEITGPYSADSSRVLKDGATYTINLQTGAFTSGIPLVGIGVAAILTLGIWALVLRKWQK